MKARRRPATLRQPSRPTAELWREDFVCVVWNGSARANRALTFERFTAAGYVVVLPGTAA